MSSVKAFCDELGLTYKRLDPKGELRYLCPKCGGDSLSVNQDTQNWQCWSSQCGSGAKVFTLAKWVQNDWPVEKIEVVK